MTIPTIDSYESAVAYLAKGRNKTYRPAGNNTEVVTTHNGVGIKLHATVIVEYRPDGTVVLNSGGWRTVTTNQRIHRHTRGIRLWSWAVHHPDDAVTAPRVTKCRTCHGEGSIATPCDGRDTRYTYPDGYNQPAVVQVVGPCWHRRNDEAPSLDPHVEVRACHRCGGAGRADYGSKPIPTPFEDGIHLDAYGMVIGIAEVPHVAWAYKPVHTPKPKPPVPSIDGDRIMTSLRRALPGIQTTVACPACNRESAIEDLIQHLNDSSHRWTREQIADWLESLDVDLAFPIPA